MFPTKHCFEKHNKMIGHHARERDMIYLSREPSRMRNHLKCRSRYKISLQRLGSFTDDSRSHISNLVHYCFVRPTDVLSQEWGAMGNETLSKTPQLYIRSFFAKYFFFSQHYQLAAVR